MAAIFQAFDSSIQTHWFANFLGKCVQFPSAIAWIIGFLILGEAKLQAQTQNNPFPPFIEQGHSISNLSESSPSVTNLDKVQPNSYGDSKIPPLLHHQSEQQPILIAAPENFNPELRVPPPPPPKPPQAPPIPPPEEPLTPVLVPDRLQVDFRDDLDNFDQHNQIIEQTAQFRLPNGQFIRFKTGFNTFEKTDFETVTNIPIQIGWEGKYGKYTLQAAGGVDLFNRLPAAFNFRAQVDRPIFINLDDKYRLKSGLFVSAIVEEGPYKSNAETLENQIAAWRLGPNVFWQIDRNTSFFSSYRWGFFNDGNFEQQSFSRLERKFGSFFAAINFFTWRFESDRQEKGGYFSPPDFLVYNGEIGWEGDIFQFLRCRINANLGRQRLLGQVNGGNSYQARCTVKFSSNAELDFGYGFSNVRNLDTGDSPYNNRSLTGQLRIKF